MKIFLRFLPGPQPPLVRYGATAAMVLAAFAIRIGVEERAGVYGFILFIPAIVAASLLFDRGSGFVALLLSTALVALSSSWRNNPDVHIATLTTFVIVGGGLVYVSDGLHRALGLAYRAEREKDLLLQEMSHRVRNKFAMILSIIGLQAREAGPDARMALEAVASRVRVIANVHDYLQLSRHDGSMDMSEYLVGLCRSLGEALGHLRPVTVSVVVDDIQLPPEKALTTGLIVNELVTNAFKYAFPDGRPGNIHVRLAKSAGNLQLSVTDDGVGSRQGTEPGLGTKLVSLFAVQLGGSAKSEAANPGCRIWVEYPVA